MKKRNSFRCIFLVLLALSFIGLSFKNLVYSGTAGVPLESNPRGIAINPITDIAVVANERSNSVSIVDLKTQAVISTIPVGSAPKGVAINTALNLALVTNNRDNSVSVIDLTTLRAIRTIPVGKGPEGIAANSNTNTNISLVVNSDNKSVTVIDLNNFNVINNIAVGTLPMDVAIDPGLNLALVTNKRDSNVSVIDLNTYQVTGVIGVGSQPQAIDINPETHLAVVANKNEKTITVIDLLSRQTTTIPVGRHPVDVAVNSLNNSALVLCDKEATLLLINLNSNIVVNSFSVNRQARGVAVNNFSNIAGVVDVSTDSLTLIQLPTVIELPNPVPSITSISPNTILRGSAATITIAGSGFVRSSSVFLQLAAGSYQLATVFMDNHYLQAEIPKDLLASAGTFQIFVTNPPVTGGDGGTSNAVNIQVNNPVPTISTLDPLETIAGTTSLNLTVYGTGFFNDTTFYINGAARPFTLISPTKIQIVLTATDLAAGGSLKVTVSNPAPGGGTSTAAIFTVLNPVPIISSISPASITAGSSGFTLTLSGNNFVRTSTISFNNQQYLTTYISSNQLKATIPSSSIQTVGDYAVSVNNPAPGGGISNQVIFKVTQTPVVEPLPEGSFGKQYEDLIPSDATITSYDPKRFSVITGLVKDRAKNPLSGVRVSIHNHSEYGSVQTDNQGRFSIPVEGGGTLTVVYEKSGFITTHRQVYIPWNDIANAETITMAPEDAAVTTVSFDGNPSTIITHKSTTITDVYGSRSLTMVFSGDNKAYSKLADGTEVLLSSITTRATEFETPESMPAKLPPNSAYTYCSELTVDGAKNVRFEKPVTVYVDNFLGFRVGEKVPVGYYDRDRAVWVPSDNGMVVRLLDTNGDGIVDALDNVGDGLPHDFNVAGLTDPAKYKPNSTYWRVSINHFTPWDCNWPYGPPAGATAPNPEGQPLFDGQQDKDDLDCTNSYCERRNRIFHEDIPLPGTDMTLHYASNRVKGYKSAITIPVSGSTVPSSLKNIIVKMEVAGRTFETTLSPLPNQKAEFIWDGLDYLGNQVTGSRIANISIGFVYQGVYYSAGNVAQAFAQAGTDVTGIRTRQEVTSWKRSNFTVHRGGGIGSIADGWTFSVHHYLSPDDFTLYKGDGTIIKSAVPTITTVAGNGQPWGFGGDGGPATQAGLNLPYSPAVDSAGNIYIADSGNHRIRRVDASGIITTVAGNGQYGNSGDGGPAIQAMLSRPSGVAVDSSGNVYIAENYQIRKVDTNGIITTVAGNGQYCYNCGGIGGPATGISISPTSVAVDSSGNLYITDYIDFSVKKVDPNGIITTVNYYGSYPMGVAVDNAGNIYESWAIPSQVIKVDTSGIITAVAGNGQGGYSGDGGPATQASLYFPQGVAVDSTGNIYIADYYTNRIRKVDTNGIITTVAGNGQRGFSGDGVPPTQASLYWPTGVAVDSVGNIYIADTYNFRIRKVALPSAYAKYVTGGDIAFADENGMGYILDSTGLHKSTIDLATGKTLLTFGYDANKQLVSITDQFGNQTTIQRDGSGIPTAITSPDGIITSLTIDSTNNLTKATYPDSASYSFTYTTDGLMTDEYDPKNNHFVHQYDTNGRITNIFDPEGGSWNYSRTVDNSGNILVNILTGEGNTISYSDHTASTGAYTSTKTDPTGATTTISRSSDGLTETQQLSCGMKLNLKYDLDTEYKYKYLKESTKTSPAGLSQTTSFTKTYQDTNADKTPDLITDTININTKNWTVTNNALTGIITSTSPVGRAITTEYDISNLLTKKLTVSGLSPSNYSYNARGRLTGVSVGSRTTAIAYDPNGNIDYIITPDNKTFDYTFDAMGRLKYEYRTDGTVIAYDYDNNGNMTVLTNPKSIANTFDHTANDQRKIWATPLSGSYLYSYDKERKLKTITFPSGKLITNTYTNGLLTSTTTPEGITNYTYGCSSLMSGAVRGTEAIAYTYDGSLLKTDTRTGLLNQTISYAYNNDFRLSSLTYAGATYSLSYDNDNLLTNAGSYTVTRNMQNGLPVSVSDGTLTNTRTFSGYGELDNNTYSVSGINKYNWNLTRDLSGRITQRVENIAGETITWDYGYNPLGRLVEVKKNGVIVESYGYDENGNRLTDNSRAYSYSTEDHVITAGTDTYQFDVDGFLTSKTTSAGTTMYNYSSRGELLSVTKPDGTLISYDHDPLGRRIAKRVNGIVTEKYLWRNRITLLAVYGGSNNLISRFNYADRRMPASMEMYGLKYYLAYDQVGSLRAVADTSGNIVKRVDYDSFGNILSDTNPSFNVPFGFAGGLHDRDTGLVRFGLRDYDPAIGRWTAKDPIDFVGSDVNLFGYVGNNPVKWIDPFGLEFEDDIVISLTGSTYEDAMNSAKNELTNQARSFEDVRKKNMYVAKKMAGYCSGKKNILDKIRGLLESMPPSGDINDLITTILSGLIQLESKYYDYSEDKYLEEYINYRNEVNPYYYPGITNIE